MKLKYYLRGIGIGIIITTIVLMIAFSIHKQQPLTDDEIRERAAELGMVMPESLSTGDKLSDTEALTQEEESSEAVGDTEAAVQKEESSKAVGDSEEKSSETGNTDKAQADEQQEADNPKEEKDEPQKEVIEQVEITIVGGEYSDAVCKKLKKAGIIEDSDDFNKYLSKGGYDNLIQPGNYKIPLDAEYDEIIKIITEKKEKKEKKG